MVILIVAGIIVILLLVLLLVIFKTEDPKEEQEKTVEGNKPVIQERILAEMPQREIIEQPSVAIETPQKLSVESVLQIDKIKNKKYRNAGEKWTKSQELKLKKLLSDGQTPAEIAKSLKRRAGAIRSKMRQLNLA